MTERLADFVMVDERASVSEPRICRPVSRCRDVQLDDYLRVTVDPPLPGLVMGQEVREVLLATRGEGRSLFPTVKFPEFVYVVQIMKESADDCSFGKDDLSLLSWGICAESEDEAWQSLASRR
jgi:hypothetical protein